MEYPKSLFLFFLFFLLSACHSIANHRELGYSEQYPDKTRYKNSLKDFLSPRLENGSTVQIPLTKDIWLKWSIVVEGENGIITFSIGFIGFSKGWVGIGLGSDMVSLDNL